MNTIWRTTLPKLRRQDLKEDGALEYREHHLNERLLDSYYARMHRDNESELKRLQREIGK